MSSLTVAFFFFFFKSSAHPGFLPSPPPHPSPVVGRSRHSRSAREGGPRAGRRPAHEHPAHRALPGRLRPGEDRKSTRLNSSHGYISYAVFCLKKKKDKTPQSTSPST